jgi:hypothetical protein
MTRPIMTPPTAHNPDECGCLCHLATPEVDCLKCNPANCAECAAGDCHGHQCDGPSCHHRLAELMMGDEDDIDPGDIGEGGWQPDVDAPLTDEQHWDAMKDAHSL